MKNFSLSETRQIKPHHAPNILGAANKLHLTALQPKVINISWTHQTDGALRGQRTVIVFFEISFFSTFSYTNVSFFPNSILEDCDKTSCLAHDALCNMILNSFCCILVTFKVYRWLTLGFCSQTVPVQSQLMQ